MKEGIHMRKSNTLIAVLAIIGLICGVIVGTTYVNKNSAANLQNDYDTLTKKYQALNDKYQALDDEYQALEKKYQYVAGEYVLLTGRYQEDVEILTDISAEAGAEIEEYAGAIKNLLLERASKDPTYLAFAISELDHFLVTDYSARYIVGKTDEDGITYDQETFLFDSAKYFAAKIFMEDEAAREDALRVFKNQMNSLWRETYFELVWLADGLEY